MNRKVVTAALALFILVNVYFLSQSSFGSKNRNPATSDPKSTPVTINAPKSSQNNNNNNNGSPEPQQAYEPSSLFEPYEPEPIEALPNNFKLCIGIHSARSYYEKRSSIRQSWLKVAQSMNNVLALFTIGDQGAQDEDPQVDTDLKQELNDYDDIALLPMVDTYHNLTRKTATWMWYVAEQRDKGLFSCEYVMKTDDDTWVNVKAVVAGLADKPKRKMAWAYWRGPENVHRGGKWGELEWPVDKYPKYPHAAGYVLSSDLTTFLGQSFMQGWLKPYANEDANMGIWLTMVHHAKINEPKFYGTHCYDGVFTLYGQTREKIIAMGQNYESCGKPCKCN